MPFGVEKLEWCGYPMVKKSLMLCLFVLTEFTNVTDTHRQTDRLTDTQTPHDGIGRAYVQHRAAKNAPTLESCSFDKRGLILTTFGKQHQHTFRNDMHIQLSLSIQFYLLYLL